MNEVRVKALQLFNWILLPGILCLFILRININDPHASIVSGGDGLLNLYFLENNYKLWSELFSTGFSDYYSPDFFWPTKNVFAFSDHLFSPGIFYSLIKSFVKSKSIAFTLWIYGTLLINYWSLRACLCVSNNWRSPFIASIVTAAAVFSPVAIQDGLGHVQLLSMFTIGPIVYRLSLIFRRDKIPSQKDLLILLTLLVIQSTFNIYTCVFIAYCVSVALLIQFAVVVRRFRINPKKNVLHEARKLIHTFRPRQLLREKNLLLFLSATLLIAILIHLPYLETINKFGDRGPLDEAQMAQPLSLLKGSAGLLLKSPFEIIQ